MFDVVHKDPETGKLSQYTVFAVLRDEYQPCSREGFLVWDSSWMELDAENCISVTRRWAQM